MHGLASLTNLTHLHLAHNYITCLQGLNELHAGMFNTIYAKRMCAINYPGHLQHLDLRDNPLSDMQQLSHLAGLVCLHTLLFAGPRGELACPLTDVPQYR